MQIINTGYYVTPGGQIFHHTDGDTHTYIDKQQFILMDDKPTEYHLHNRVIYYNHSPTAYRIIGNDIFGPFRLLPWMHSPNRLI